MNDQFEVIARPIPPPEEEPACQFGETLGLLRGLRALKFDERFSCPCCSKRRAPNSWAVMVPDGIRISTPASAVIETCRLTAYNGTFSMWCLDCAKKIGAKRVAWYVRLARWFVGKAG
jgi:hypothetical protein